MKDEALKLALEALEVIYDRAVFDYSLPADHFAAEGAQQAITAIKEALAQPEQEPYGYLKLNTGKFVNEVEGLNPMTDKRYLPLYTTPPQRKPKNLMQVKRISDQSIELVFTSCAAASEFENGIKG